MLLFAKHTNTSLHFCGKEILITYPISDKWKIGDNPLLSNSDNTYTLDKMDFTNSQACVFGRIYSYKNMM